ncbi:ATP-binding cassette domain-containing protein [Actinomyces provencensis]|uniref:ATP-binding cassette domain-containing protein n=1 Tax=Actinomyces provencensis TaxID=1720198 RepID=UPI00096AA310|nr:ATP-binding cassette domain-containing protein [Actinomyces provencensis]
MLQLRNVRKSYTVADFTQVALDDVSISFRDCEFVAVLGPSGSGKTTLLNVVGGLDHYDAGDLVIDGVSTRQFRDGDWDTYRNNRIGFVFQSYNLIPHQSVLANVELALTLSGVGRAERRERATRALEDVGLGEHVHKLPSQLSGGQMQRVAIARALINDPEIVLADEPTGALDSTTSVQVMDLLSGIARDRLVVMVTHNPELAEQYATRTVTLRDGEVVDDTRPFDPTAGAGDARDAKPVRRTSMSFPTALSLSFRNLMTKRGRTLMTAFAGSIGIIGIATILSLANGVNGYIKSVEEETLSVYPLTIQSQGLDMTSLLAGSAGSGGGGEDGNGDEGDAGGPADGDEGDQPSSGAGEIPEVSTIGTMFAGVGTNDLASLKRFLDGDGGGIEEFANSIEYTYDVTPQIFQSDTSSGVRQVNPDATFAPLGLGSAGSQSSLLSSYMSTSVFHQLMSDRSLVEGQYDVVAGHWPDSADETLVVLLPDGGISDFMLYAMGLRDASELDRMVAEVAEGKDVSTPVASGTLTARQILDTTFRVVDATDYYVHDDTYDVWMDRSGNQDHLRSLVEDGEPLRISGIVRQKPEVRAAALQPGIYYTPALTERISERASRSGIVRDQLAHPSVDVFTGRTFAEENAGTGAGSGEDVDLGSLITVDQEALARAFTFDGSALALDASALDLSGLDLSGLVGAGDLAGVDLSGLDLSHISIDATQLPELDLGQVAAGVDVEDLLSGIDLGEVLAGVDYDAVLGDLGEQVTSEQAQELAANLARGFAEYCAQGVAEPDSGIDCAADPRAAFQEFLDSPAGRDIQEQNRQAIEELTSALEGAGQELSDQVLARLGQAIQEQVAASGDQLQAQLTAAMQDYMQRATQAYMTQLSTQLSTQIGSQLRQQLGAQVDQMSSRLQGTLQAQLGSAMTSAATRIAENMSGAMGIDEDALRGAFRFDMDQEELSELLVSLISSRQASLEGNLATLGHADPDKPFAIALYPKDFESKGAIIDILDTYNADMEAAGQEDKAITYTDIVGTLMSSVTTIIDVVTYVLTAFVAISLVVSSIMIGVITYISVLERKKEIGILRSIGASKRDIRRVFNAETVIVGLVAGLMGIGVTLLLTIPANAVVDARYHIANVAQLPWVAGVALVGISMGLTFLAGLLPSSAASRSDPVEALRSE